MKALLTTALLAAGLYTSHTAAATDVIRRDSLTRGGYTLIFINEDPAFVNTGKDVQERMINTFFDVYPRLAAAYNPETLKKVVFKIDPQYDGVAATANGVVTYNPAWMLKQPTDIDVVTHEVMHIVQNYGNSRGPGWLTEGIADYVRYKFGVDNAGARWALPAFNEKQHYSNSYRITARFLAWLEKSVQPGIVKVLDKSLRDHTYTAGIWKEQTGKSLDELWTAYSANPAL